MKPLVRSVAASVARSVLTVAPSDDEEPAEFITNGGYDSGANWVTGAGWMIGSGVASSDGGIGLLSQDFGALTRALTNGNDYLLSYALVNPNGGAVRARFSGGTGGQNFDTVAAGSITQPFTASDARTTLSFQSLDAEAVSVDNVSISPA